MLPLDVGCLVLATMTPELQKQHEYMVAYEMIQNLKEILKGEHDNREFLLNKGNVRNIELKEVQQQQVHEPEVEETPQIVEENSTDLETQPLRRFTRERHEPERYGFLVTTHGDVILVDQDKPKTYQEAVSSPDSEKWLEAMRSEMDSFMTSRYQANPGEGHWTTVKNILKYLRRTKDVSLVYGGKEELGIKGYIDKSSKQDTIVDSTTKAEYVAAIEATKETVWIKEFISELRVIISIADAAIAQAKEPRSHHRPKHTFKCFYLI
ncbi:hypothetical protein V6N13_015189 [Hibiscus sabdariffa]